MSQADSHNTTRATADASRRRFLAFTAAASAVSAGSLAMAAVPSPVHQCLTADAEAVATGAQFEALFTRWMPAWFEWARLHCEARDEAEAKFGEQDGDNEAWTKPFLGTAPAGLFKDEALKRKGCDAAAEVETALFEQMMPFADVIREAEVTSVAGLRAKTLLSILDFWPVGAEDENFCSELTETGHYSLFAGAVAVTGMSGLVGKIEKHLASKHCMSLRDCRPIIA